MSSYDNNIGVSIMRKLKELLIRIKALFGVIHPTNPFIVDLIMLCRYSTDVQVHYFGGPKQQIQIAVNCNMFDWTIFVGHWQELIHVVHGEVIEYNPQEVRLDSHRSCVCFHISILDLNIHDVNVLANFSQSAFVADTNIKLGAQPKKIDFDKCFQPVGDGYFTLA